MTVGTTEGDDNITRAGSLKSCQWTILTSSFSPPSSRDHEDSDTALDGADGWGITEGIRVELEYEKVNYTALLLRAAGDRNGRSVEGEEKLPFLMLRMPSAVREVFIDYISTAFDARIDTMRLPANVLGEALEGYLEEVESTEDGIQKLVKEIQLSLGFKVEGLKSLDITIKREDIIQFLNKGREVVSKGVNGKTKGPFMVALKQYLSNHLALDVEHGDVFLARVACGAFALGREGKFKLFAPSFDYEDEDEDESSDPVAIVSKNASIRLVKLLLTVASDTTMSLDET